MFDNSRDNVIKYCPVCANIQMFIPLNPSQEDKARFYNSNILIECDYCHIPYEILPEEQYPIDEHHWKLYSNFDYARSQGYASVLELIDYYKMQICDNYISKLSTFDKAAMSDRIEKRRQRDIKSRQGTEEYRRQRLVGMLKTPRCPNCTSTNTVEVPSVRRIVFGRLKGDRHMQCNHCGYVWYP